MAGVAEHALHATPRRWSRLPAGATLLPVGPPVRLGRYRNAPAGLRVPCGARLPADQAPGGAAPRPRVQRHRAEGRNRGPSVCDDRGSDPAPPGPDGPSLGASRRSTGLEVHPGHASPETPRSSSTVEGSTHRRHPRGHAPPGSHVTVKGWVRTRRDSKAGLSFVASMTAPASTPSRSWRRPARQLRERGPAPHDRLRGHGHRHRGRVAGQGPDRGDPGGRGDRRRLGGRPRHLPRRGQAPHLRVPPRGRPPALADQHLRRRRARPAHARDGHPPLLRRARLLLDPHADHHAPDCEGAGEMFRVSTLDLANLPRTPEGAIDYAQDFFGKPASLTVSGQLNVETYCLALSKVYTFGPDLPRRELQHQPPPGRVLDGRAGDRLRRPLRRRRPGGGLPQVHLQGAAGRARRRHEVLRRAHRQTPSSASRTWSTPASSA